MQIAGCGVLYVVRGIRHAACGLRGVVQGSDCAA